MKKRRIVKPKRKVVKPAAIRFKAAKGGKCTPVPTPRPAGGFYWECKSEGCDGTCKLWLRGTGGAQVEVGCDCV